MAKVIASRSLRFRGPKNGDEFSIAPSIYPQEIPDWAVNTLTFSSAQKSQWIRIVTDNPFQPVPSALTAFSDAEVLAEAHKRSLQLVSLEPAGDGALDLSSVSTSDLYYEIERRDAGSGERIGGSPLALMAAAEKARRQTQVDEAAKAETAATADAAKADAAAAAKAAKAAK